ncbi:MAG: lipopolysaccharide biosynthesis protein [Atopobiaceae bacterium]|nr:lipopolysaccharide biosynthesis protein [Atopobiaceae bacterium]
MTLFELLGLLRKRLGLVILLPLLAAAIVGVGTMFLPNEYTASTTMYVLSKTDDESATSVTTQELSAGQMLTNDVSTILKSSRVKNDVADQLGLENLSDYDLSITSSTTTRVITLSVTGTDPEMTTNVANALVADTSQVASEVMQIQSVNVIDAATVPQAPSGPRRLLYVAVGLLAGLFAAVCIVVIQDMLDTRVRSGNDVEEIVGVPVIGHFPQI